MPNPNVPEYNPNKPTLYVGWSGYHVQEFSFTLASDMAKCGYYTMGTRILGISTILDGAAFKFGQTIETAIVHFFREGIDPVDTFNVEWGKWAKIPLQYGDKDESWNNLLQIGRALLRQFNSYQQTLNWTNVRFGEKLRFENWYKGVDLIYIADVLVDFPNGKQLVDIKTAGASYPDPEKNPDVKGWPAMDPQLLTGALVSGIRDVAYLNLVKTKTPKIQFIEGSVTEESIADIDGWLKEQFDKLAARKFHRNFGFKFPNNHCTFCDLLPKCMGNEEEFKKTLRIKTKKDTDEQMEAFAAFD